jgi:hypothetical protein
MKVNNVTITKYRADRGCGATLKPRIEKVEVEKETENHIVINGRRYAKTSFDGDCYFDSWEKAKEHLRIIFTEKVCEKERALESARSLYHFVVRIEKPNAEDQRAGPVPG